MHQLTEALRRHEEGRAVSQATGDAVKKILDDGEAVLSEHGQVGTSGYERADVRLETLAGKAFVLVRRTGDRAGMRLTLEEAVALARWLGEQDLAGLLADATAAAPSP